MASAKGWRWSNRCVVVNRVLWPVSRTLRHSHDVVVVLLNKTLWLLLASVQGLISAAVVEFPLAGGVALVLLLGWRWLEAFWERALVELGLHRLLVLVAVIRWALGTQPRMVARLIALP
jgi:hypothetical protein